MEMIKQIVNIFEMTSTALPSLYHYFLSTKLFQIIRYSGLGSTTADYAQG